MCLIALQASARRRPRLALVLKTGADRVVVTADLAARMWARDGSLDGLLHVAGDRLREVFVAAGAPDVHRSYDWSSLSAAREGEPRAFRSASTFLRPDPPGGAG
ncbi:MAG TPA: hypothetical protein VFI47_01185 [Acidimicrobiales bacterium]|nr:hypothetical protein [Acidimicrobiales bacterium]